MTIGKEDEWLIAKEAWKRFTQKYPLLGYPSGQWGFHNFLRHNRDALCQQDAIRRARNTFWIAHAERFNQTAFELATRGKLRSKNVEGVDEPANVL